MSEVSAIVHSGKTAGIGRMENDSPFMVKTFGR